MKILFFPKTESGNDGGDDRADTAIYEKIVKGICYILCIFEFLAMLFLPVAYFVLGAFRVFSLPFSIPSLFSWVSGLDNLPIFDPSVQLSEYYIGWVYVVLYLIFALPVIVQSIRVYQLFQTLSHFDYRENDYLDGLRNSTAYTLSGYSYIILMILFACFTAQSAILPAGVSSAIIATLCFFILACFRDFYTAYDAKRRIFYFGYFLINGIKTALIFAVAIGILWFGCKPFLVQFISEIGYAFDSGIRYEGADVIKHYVMPACKVIYGLVLILLFRKTLSYGVTSAKIDVYDASGKTTKTDRNLKQSLKGSYKGVIGWSIVFFLVECLWCCFPA